MNKLVDRQVVRDLVKELGHDPKDINQVKIYSDCIVVVYVHYYDSKVEKD